jgi:hypothetical protein
MLLANIRTSGALVWTLLLFIVFAICTGHAWARGLDISCGCLKLGLIGIGRGSEAAKFIESPAFACARAVLLGALTAALLAGEIRRNAADAS